ncbi:MAG: HlyC/CorC family transporter [Candidatus Krumholzibacteriota bacterium]|nr:HlyC/CorC family transporter [Candidatus Krumholzibacteriota bacterium]
MEYILLIISVVIFLALSALFSGAETALFSLSGSYLAQMAKGSSREQHLASMMKSPRMLLVTVLFGNLLVNIANTSVVTALAIRTLGDSGPGISMVVMTLLILIFGEITPKSLAMKHSVSIALAVSPILRFLMFIFTPVRLLLGLISDLTVRGSRILFGVSEKEYRSHELVDAVEMAGGSGLFDEFESRILTNLFQFTERAVYEILTPRVDVFSMDADTELQDAVIEVRSRGFTRIPLYEDSAENIIGLFHARDLLRYEKDEKKTLRDIMLPADFVPETKKIRDLFGEFITDRKHVSFAVDEHGSFEGIITLEDILEEIFGEIRDRREANVDEFNLIDEDRIIVEGNMRLEDLNVEFGSVLDSKEVETAGGYLIEKIGRIPREGETFLIDSYRWLVLSAEATKINKIKIERNFREEE